MFIPGTSNSAELDVAMRVSLSESLEHIFSIGKSRLNLPGAETESALLDIRSHRVTPGVFGRYYKAVLAVQAGRFDDARRLILQLARAAQEVAQLKVAPYSKAGLGEEELLYAEVIDPDRGLCPWFVSPTHAESLEEEVNKSLGYISIADPALADELRGLLIQVVGASPSSDPKSRPFGSVSSFMLWGLMILNVERYRTAAELIQVLVHEAAHLLLFAHSIAEPLVTNAIEERYASPLRPDPRPMDGVFHATFVSARLYYVNKRLLEAATATFAPVPVEELEDRLRCIRTLYLGGLKTVQDHGKLTASGRFILEETLDYMKAA